LQLDIWIARAEKTWVEVLHSHAAGLFGHTYLPSHDHTHHRRVWNICRELLKELARKHTPIDESLVEGVLVAAYFHDLGMVTSIDVEHGKSGRDMCSAFFKDHDLQILTRMEEVLESIELHDVKDERIYKGIFPGKPADILSILSIADDLEALGTIGIYRYAEIYLQRRVSLVKLGDMVIKNAEVRFNNIKQHAVACTDLVEKYREEYDELISFYSQYNRQLYSVREPQEVHSDHLGAVNFIYSMSVEGNIPPQEFQLEAARSNTSKFVTDFFRKLKDELERARN